MTTRLQKYKLANKDLKLEIKELEQRNDELFYNKRNKEKAFELLKDLLKLETWGVSEDIDNLFILKLEASGQKIKLFISEEQQKIIQKALGYTNVNGYCSSEKIIKERGNRE